MIIFGHFSRFLASFKISFSSLLHLRHSSNLIVLALDSGSLAWCLSICIISVRRLAAVNPSPCPFPRLTMVRPNSRLNVEVTHSPLFSMRPDLNHLVVGLRFHSNGLVSVNRHDISPWTDKASTDSVEHPTSSNSCAGRCFTPSGMFLRSNTTACSILTLAVLF